MPSLMNLHPRNLHPSGLGASLSCMALDRDGFRGDRRRPWADPEFSDAACQATLMAGGIEGRHITGMDQKNAALRIFIADDSSLIRERVASMLRACAMTIVGQAETPQDSIEGILAVYPDVVVLDVQLEGGSGLQVLRAIRHAAPDIAFVIFSNSSDPGYRKCYLGAGADHFLDKSHEFDQLAKAVFNASQHADY
ncbi:response regulator [Polaromonas sp.]|uniref:response regulator n=1 Tax=Polaromonas sp. TaxID=1869339 RepID=UPI003BB80098